MILISKFKIITRGIYGLLIFCVLVILVFTLNNFGVDTATVSAGYRSTQRLATSTLAFTNTVTTYKDTMDIQIESIQQKAANGQIDPVTGELLYEFPLHMDDMGNYTGTSSITITCDLAVYGNGDSAYKTKGVQEGGSHNGIDFVPTGSVGDNAGKNTIPIYAPCDGVFHWHTGATGYNAFYIRDECYDIYFYHMSKIESNLSENASVKKGQLLGYMGGKGPGGTQQYGSHLHVTVFATGSSTRINMFKIGAWDMKGVSLIMNQNMPVKFSVDDTKEAVGVSPCTWSYIQNLRECPSFTNMGVDSSPSQLYTVTYTKNEDGSISYNASSYDINASGWPVGLAKEFYPETEASN